jgi:hypothetical protein
MYHVNVFLSVLSPALGALLSALPATSPEGNPLYE